MTPVQQAQAPKQATSATSERSTEIESSDLLIPSLQRSVAPRAQLSPQNVLYLQRTIGNTAVQRLLGPGSNATTGSTHASMSSHPDVITQAESPIQRKLGVGLADNKFARGTDDFSKQAVSIQRAAATRPMYVQRSSRKARKQRRQNQQNLPFHMRERPTGFFDKLGDRTDHAREVAGHKIKEKGARLIDGIEDRANRFMNARVEARAFAEWKATEPWAKGAKRPDDLAPSLYDEFLASDIYRDSQANLRPVKERDDKKKNQPMGPTDKDIKEMNKAKKRFAKGELRDVRKARRRGKIHNMKRGAFEHVPHHQGISQIAQSPQVKQYGLSKFVPDFVKVGKFNLEGFDQAEEEAQGQMQESEEQYESGESMVNF